MSVRNERKKQHDAIIDRLYQLQLEQEAHVVEETALKSALEALGEEPRQLTSTTLMLQYSAINTRCEISRCSECGQDSTGYTKAWKWAPCCGSAIAKVERELSPRDRVIADTAKQALSKINALQQQ